MQRIERYGVIALLLLLVTVLAVSMWGEDTVDPKDASTHTLASVAPTRRATPPERKPVVRNTAANTRKRETSQLPGNLPLTDRRGGTQARPGQTPNAAAAANRPRVVKRGKSTPQATPDANLARNRNRNRNQNPATQNNNVAAAGRNQPRTERQNNSIRPASNLIVKPTDKPTITPARNLPSAAVVQKKPKTWTVKSGETLSEIAQSALGSAVLWRKIVEINPSVDPNRLSVGTKLILPNAAEIQAAPKAVVAAATLSRTTPVVNSVTKGAAGTYTVQSGDVLSMIAQRELGSSRLWHEIVSLNPGLNPDRLVVGARIKLPQGVAVNRPRSTSTQVAAANPKPRTVKRNRVR